MVELHTAGNRRGVICAPHAGAVDAGRSTLAEGGNALEAMIAMAASVAVVYPHMNHLGGDGFWLIRWPSGHVRAIMAPGPAGHDARLELYQDYETIPPRGPLAALTVPGAVGGWILAFEAARASGGTLPLDVLLTTAIGQARNGYTVTRSQARLTAEKLAELATVPGFADTFLIEGKPPAVGDILKQEALAATWRNLPMPASTIFTAVTSDAKWGPTSNASAVRSSARTSRAMTRRSPTRFMSNYRPGQSTTPRLRRRASLR
jgi:oxamate amidohydrolase